jgi:hypothetical protein
MDASEGSNRPADILHGDDPSDRTEFGAYRPNRHDLRVLARFWAEVWLDIDTEMFSCGYEQICGCCWADRAYAWSRFNEIAGVGGADLARDALEAAKRERRQHEDPLFWECYDQGDVERLMRLCPPEFPDGDDTTAPPTPREGEPGDAGGNFPTEDLNVPF